MSDLIVEVAPPPIGWGPDDMRKAIELADWINGQLCLDGADGTSFIAEVVPASDCIYVEISVIRRDRRGRPWDDPSRLRVRISSVVQAEACTVAIDPTSGNSVADAKRAFAAAHMGGPPVVLQCARTAFGQVSSVSVHIDGRMASWDEDVVAKTMRMMPVQLEMFP